MIIVIMFKYINKQTTYSNNHLEWSSGVWKAAYLSWDRKFLSILIYFPFIFKILYLGLDYSNPPRTILSATLRVKIFLI